MSEQFNQLLSVNQQLRGMRHLMSPETGELYDSIQDMIPRLRPKPNYSVTAKMFAADAFKDDDERRGALNGFFTAHMGEASADPIEKFYAMGGKTSPKNLSEVSKLAAEISQARYDPDSLFKADPEKMKAAVDKKMAELKKADEGKGRGLLGTVPGMAYSQENETMSDEEYRKKAREELFKDDRVLQLNSILSELSKPTRDIVNTAAHLQDYDTWVATLAKIPPNERAAAASAIYMSNPAQGFVPKFFASATRETYQGAVRTWTRRILKNDLFASHNISVLDGIQYNALGLYQEMENLLGKDRMAASFKEEGSVTPGSEEDVRAVIRNIVTLRLLKIGDDYDWTYETHKAFIERQVEDIYAQAPSFVSWARSFEESEDIERQAERAFAPRLPDDASLGHKMAKATAEILPFTGAVALAGMAGGPVGGFLMGHEMQYDSVYARYKEHGYTSAQSALAANVTVPIISSLESLGAMKVFQFGKGKLYLEVAERVYPRLIMEQVKRHAVDMGVEEITEISQQIVEQIPVLFSEMFAEVENLDPGQAWDEIVEVAKQTAMGLPGLMVLPAGRDVSLTLLHAATDGKVSAGQAGAYADMEIALHTFLKKNKEIQETLEITEDENGNAVITIPEEFRGEELPEVPVALYQAWRSAKTAEDRQKVLDTADKLYGLPDAKNRLEILEILEGELITQARKETLALFEGTVLTTLTKRGEEVAAKIEARLKDGSTVESVLAELIAKHNKGKANVVSVKSTKDLLLRDDLSDSTKSEILGILQRRETLEGFIEGDTVFLVQDAFTDSPGKLVAKFAHEFLAHGQLGEAQQDIKERAAEILGRGGFLQAWATALVGSSSVYRKQFTGKDGNIDPAAVADEVLARIAEGMIDGKTLALEVRPLWKRLRDYAGEKLGIETAAEWTDREIASLLRQIMNPGQTQTTDNREAARFSARTLTGDIGTGRGYTDFFGNFHEAQGDEWFYPHGEYEPAIALDEDADAFQRVRGKYMGNFDLHIATSIPGFSDLQAIVGDALVKAYGEQGARVLDIGASEGAFVKALAELTGGRISSIALDPNPKMRATFREKGQVEGVEYRLEALGAEDVRGDYAWSEIDKDTGIATQINYFNPGDEKFDVVHEAMVFQFMSNQRASQLDLVKNMMAPDGVVILEEKFAQGDVDQYNANEDKKDYEWKSKYYTEEQIERKRKEVLEKGGDTIEGMTKMQVSVEEIDGLLAERFNYFAQFWDSGNFMGFIASDSEQALKKVLDNMQDTKSEFSSNPVGEVQSSSRYSVEETRKAQAVHELQVLQVPLRTDGRLQLTHWSPVAGLASLEPAEFGTGPVFGQERRRAGKGFLNRVQFGLAGYRREVDPGHRYMTSVEPGELYPILRDPLNLREQARPVLGQKGDGTPILGSGVDLNRYEQLIQENGYKGFISQSQYGPVAALFESVPVESVVENDTSSYAPVEVDAQGNDALRSWNFAQNLGYMGGLIFRRAGSPAGMENNNLPRYSVVPRKVDALGFYSPIRAEVEAMDFKQIPPRQLADRIRKLPKQEEMEDLGLYDWLELQDGKVTKEAVLAFIDQGGVQLNQIINSEEEAAAQTPEFDFGSIVQEEHDDDFIREVAEENLDQFIEDNQLQDDIDEGVLTRDQVLEQAMEEERINRSDDLGYSREVEVSLGDKTFTFFWNWTPYDGHELYSKDFQEDVIDGQYQQGYMDNPVAEQLIRRFLEDKGEITEEDANEPQYANYVMNGDSSNYREFILTLPEGGGDTPSAREVRTWYETGEFQRSYAKKNIPWTELSSEAQQEVFEALKRKRDVRQPFTHGHWPGIQNPLVHFRTTDRRVDGKPTLFLEEIQSDWIQQGRKKGFKGLTAEDEARLAEINARLKELNDIRIANGGGDLKQPYLDEATSLMEEERTIKNKDRVGVPDPRAFKRSGTVDLLAFKRALAIAVAEGYDSIAWTPAVEQIRRWSDSLQQEVRSISWSPGDPNADARLEELRTNIASWQETLKETRQARELAFKMDDAQGMTANDVTIERLITAITEAKIDIDKLKKVRTQPAVLVETINAYNPDMTLYYDEQGVITGYENAGGRGNELIGKNLSEVFDNSIAKQILSEESGRLEGDGLTIGGKGFKDFYDGLLPREVQKYVKKMGGRVGVGNVEISRRPRNTTEALRHKPESEEVWNVEITDQMRDEVSMGQPRYSISGGFGESGSILDQVEINEEAWSKSSDTRFSVAPLLGVDEPERMWRRELTGAPKFLFASNRVRVGSYNGLDPESGINITLQGGPGYAFDSGAAWAVNSQSLAKQMVDKKGYGLITLFGPENTMGDLVFAKAYVAEVRHAIATGKLTKTRFLHRANQLRVAAKSTKTLEKGTAWAKMWGTQWKTVEEFEAALLATPPDARRAALFGWSPKPKKTSDNRGSKIGRDDLVKEGFPNLTDMLGLINDPAFEAHQAGMVIGAVEFTGEYGPASELGVPHHPSYQFAVGGRGLGIFEDPVHMREISEPIRKSKSEFRTLLLGMPEAKFSVSGGSFNVDEFYASNEAAVEFAARILDGAKLNKEAIKPILEAEYPEADPTTVLFKAHAIAKHMAPEWENIKKKSSTEAHNLLASVASQFTIGDQAADVYKKAEERFRTQYIRGGNAEEIRQKVESRRKETARKQNALSKEELEDQGLWITDPTEQLDIEEQFRRPPQRAAAEEKEEGSLEQAAAIEEADVLEVTEIPKSVVEYINDLREAVAKKTGLKESDPDFFDAYSETLALALKGSARSLMYGKALHDIFSQIDHMSRLKNTRALEARAQKILTKVFQESAYADRKTLVKKLESIINKKAPSKKVGKTTSSWYKDPLPKVVMRQLRKIKKYMHLEPHEVAIEIDNRKRELDSGLENWNKNPEPDVRKEEQEQELEMEIELLEKFGALGKLMPDGKPFRTLGEIRETVETAITEIESAIDAQKKNIELRRQRIDAQVGHVKDAVLAGSGKVKKSKRAARRDERELYAASIERRFLDLIDFADKKLKAILWNNRVNKEGVNWSLKDLARRIKTAQHSVRIRKTEDLSALVDAIGTIYGTRTETGARAKLAALLRPNKAYAKFSKKANPGPLSKFHLMQMLAFMEQSFYADNVTKHGRESQAEEIRNTLDQGDLQLLDWMRDFYKRKRPELSAKKKSLTGIGFPTDLDDNYMPVGVSRYGGFRGLMTTLQITPPIFSERRRHQLDLNENEDALSLFLDRSHKSAVYLEMAEIAMEVSDLFGNPEIQQAIEEVFGKDYWNELHQHLFDTMSQKPLRYDVEKGNSWLRAYNGVVMFFNLASAARQVSSSWEYAVDHSLWKVASWQFNLVKPWMWKHILEVLNSDQAKARRQTGPSFEESLLSGVALTSEGAALSDYVGQVLRKYGMAPNKLMDAMTIATIGAGVYKEYMDEFIRVGMDEEQAKKLAMEWTWSETTEHQQSSDISNQAPWQRSGSVSTMLLRSFTSTPQQWVGIQNQLMRHGRNTGDWKPFVKSIVLHHLIGPAIYKSVELVFNLALGRKPDEDELPEWIAFMVLGPYSGTLVGKYLMSLVIENAIDLATGSNLTQFGGEDVPALAGAQAAIEALDMVKEIQDGNGQAVMDSFDDLLDILPPWRYASEIKENYLDQ